MLFLPVTCQWRHIIVALVISIIFLFLCWILYFIYDFDIVTHMMNDWCCWGCCGFWAIFYWWLAWYRIFGIYFSGIRIGVVCYIGEDGYIGDESFQLFSETLTARLHWLLVILFPSDTNILLINFLTIRFAESSPRFLPCKHSKIILQLIQAHFPISMPIISTPWLPRSKPIGTYWKIFFYFCVICCCCRWSCYGGSKRVYGMVLPGLWW